MFKGSLSVAISHVYPNIGIVKSKFKHLTKGKIARYIYKNQPIIILY